MSTALAPGRALTIVRHAFDVGGACIRDRNTDAFMASCPLHDDLNPSLSVTWKTRPNREGGAVLMHCFSCNAGAADIAAALGLSMADLFDDPAARRLRENVSRKHFHLGAHMVCLHADRRRL